MHVHTLRRALVPMLAASALTCLVPAAGASAAPVTPTAEVACESGATGGDVAIKRPGERLASGETLNSPRRNTELVMQADGNLVLYALGNPGGAKLPLWSTGTYGNPGAYAAMQEDGNFVVYKKGGGPDKGGALWATGTYGDRTDTYPGAYLRADGEFFVEGRSYSFTYVWTTAAVERSAKVCEATEEDPRWPWLPGNWGQSATVWMVMQKDGNLVIYRKSDGKAIWSTGTYGAKYRVDLTMDPKGDLILRERDRAETLRWHSNTEGSKGAFALLQDDGNFVVYKKTGGPDKGGALWDTGTYNKI
ncbi:hypothetical protein ACFXA3_04615 [Streptomyces sp. NPDC059456]|uniref:hypothetical protein n=1 Tax=Streptomyces sp. NPDC059456 TaxID=3346838 RepID=UPI0036AC64A8